MRDKSGIDNFIDNLLIFIETDYLNPSHNMKKNLKYSVKEIDEHYLGDYRFLFDKYYQEFCELKSNGNYEYLSIVYNEALDDYLIEVDIKQMDGALEREVKRQKELDEFIKEQKKLVEEGKLDEVNPGIKWMLGID